jgi:histidine ammonia-lyase
MMALAQAVDCLKIADKLAPTTRELYNQIREIVPVFVEDTPKYKEIEAIIDWLKK